MSTNTFSSDRKCTACTHTNSLYHLLLLVLFCLMPLSNLSAQSYSYQQYDFMNEMVIQSKSSVNTLQYSDIKGNPYSSKELLPGTIELFNGELLKPIPMRYNWYSKKMEAQLENQLIALDNTTKIKSIELESNKYVPFFKIPSLEGYIIELHTGYYNLYRQVSVKLYEAEPAESGYDEAKPARFKRTEPIFIVITTKGEIIQLSSGKKTFAKQFPKIENKILNHIREQKTNLKDEGELLELVLTMESWQD